MGDVTDFLKKYTQLANTDVTALNFAESAIKAVSGFVGAVNTTKTILVALGIFENTDALGVAVKELKADFDDAVTRSDEHSTMRDIANLVGPAETALTDLRTLAPDDPSTPGDDNWQAVRGQVLDAPLTAINSMEFQDAYWKRPFFPEGAYQDRWVRITPPNEGGYVFDYRLTLAAYLEVVSIWVVTRSALVPGWRLKNQSEFAKRAQFLEDKLSLIRSAITRVEPPLLWQAVVGDGTGSSVWNDAGRPFGVVEAYSTENVAQCADLQVGGEAPLGPEGRRCCSI